MRIARVLSVFAVMVAASLQSKAQLFTMNTQVNVHFPYAFVAEGHQFAPGDYSIRRVGDETREFTIANSKGHVLAFLEAAPDQQLDMSPISAVVLHTDGEQYFLDELRVQGLRTRFQFLSPKINRSRERERHASVFEVPATRAN